MGSYADKFREEDDDLVFTNRKNRIAIMVEYLNNIDVRSQEYLDIKWLFENKPKLLRNKELIKLLG